MSLHAEAALGAVADAGLGIGDIDGLLCAYSLAEPHPMLSSAVAEYLGISAVFESSLSLGGATAATLVMQAAALIEAGVCRHVLALTGDNRLTGMSRDGAVAALAGFGHPQFEQPYGMSIPAAYGMVAQRYMHEFGLTAEQMAAVAVVQRKHAARHPQAHMREPITLEDVLQSRMIASPLHLLDCCLVSDGAAAVVISTGDARNELPKPAVGILGAGQGHTHEHIVAAPSLVDFGCKNSAALAFRRAGLSVSDIDVAEIYDSFTITLIVELESIGFFARGEAGPAIAHGALELDGVLPCNTHGGLLSYGHSGAAGGMFHVVEAVRQLRREANTRQVKDAELAFVHGDGGVLSAHCSLVLGRL
ncbi:thiolase family protein [Paralcaligenes ginsengisoli]